MYLLIETKTQRKLIDTEKLELIVAVEKMYSRNRIETTLYIGTYTKIPRRRDAVENKRENGNTGVSENRGVAGKER
jgi:hypothetical protein